MTKNKEAKKQLGNQAVNEMQHLGWLSEEMVSGGGIAVLFLATLWLVTLLLGHGVYIFIFLAAEMIFLAINSPVPCSRRFSSALSMASRISSGISSIERYTFPWTTYCFLISIFTAIRVAPPQAKNRLEPHRDLDPSSIARSMQRSSSACSLNGLLS
jgi:hypothetical protein